MTAPETALRYDPVAVRLVVREVPESLTVRWTLHGGDAQHCTGTSRSGEDVGTTCWAYLDDLRRYHLTGSAQLVDAGGTTVATVPTGVRVVDATEQTDASMVSAAELAAVRRCHNRTRHVQLTFDDHGSAVQVRRIVSALDERGVRGRFFFTGSWARRNPGLVRHVTSHGHLVGNHTATHLRLSTASDADVLREISGGVAATTRPRLLRPPYGAGAATRRLATLAAERRHRVCTWTVDTRDWEGASVRTIVRRVRSGDGRTPRIEAGGVVLMHAQAPHTAAAVPGVVAAVRARGLTLEPKPLP